MSLHLQFSLQKNTFQLNVATDIPSTGITAIYGKSGSGKTTLLRAIAGLEPNLVGKATFNEELWQDSEQKIFLKPERRQIGLVLQDPLLFPHLKVRENLSFAERRCQKSAHDDFDFSTIVGLTGIEHLLTHQTQQLSGGESQRVALARALLSNPKLILLDEPFSALDIGAKQDLMPVLEDIRHRLKIPIILISHDQNEVARLADHLVIMTDGKIAATGPLSEVLIDESLPLAQMHSAVSVLKAKVDEHDETFQLTNLACSAGPIFVSKISRPIGDRVRIAINAHDVSLTLCRPEQTSILNVFQTEVVSIHPTSASQNLVKLQVGNEKILARITRKSSEQLCLQPGMAIYAQVKSVSLL